MVYRANLLNFKYGEIKKLKNENIEGSLEDKNIDVFQEEWIEFSKFQRAGYFIENLFLITNLQLGWKFE